MRSRALAGGACGLVVTGQLVGDSRQLRDSAGRGAGALAGSRAHVVNACWHRGRGGFC